MWNLWTPPRRRLNRAQNRGRRQREPVRLVNRTSLAQHPPPLRTGTSTARNSQRSIETAPVAGEAASENGVALADSPILCEFCMTVRGNRGNKLSDRANRPVKL